MELVKLKISDIKPYEKNARKNDKAVEAVAKSIEQCTYVAPIIVDENHVILAGHTRWKAMKRLGRTECECIVKDGLTEDQKKKYRLLDNKTNELADWDFDMLPEELEVLDFGDLVLDWGVENQKEPEIKKTEIKPFKKAHILISIDINQYDRVLETIQAIETECDGVEIERALN